MRVAVKKAARGDPARLPVRLQYHLVAAAMGRPLDEVRAMDADDFADAVNMLPLTLRG